MLTLLDTITGFIAPHECLACGNEGALLCLSCIDLLATPVPRCYRCGRTDNGWYTCTSCRRHSTLEQVFVTTLYEGFAEALVHKFKFERAYGAHTSLARAMAPLVSNQNLLIPIPTATNRVRQRGYDQSVLIAKELARLSGGRSARALERIGQKRQTGSSRAERLKQLIGAFEVRTGTLKGVERVLLVDDVITTGATLEAAAAELRNVGIKHISAVVFARAE